MPDFTIEIRQQCTSSLRCGTIGGYSQSPHDMSCTCKGFTFRKTCKHIKEYQASLCYWHESYSDESQTEEEHQNHICPICHSSTELVQVAV